jgi:hypothetical protein
MAEPEPEPQIEHDRDRQEGAEHPGSPAPKDRERNAAQDVNPEQSEGKDTASLRREAASYRRKLRDAEGEAERLAQRVAEMQKSAIEDQVVGPGKLADGSDVWLTGVKLEDLLDEDGAINAEKVKGALEQTLAEHPSWKQRQGPGLGGGARGTGHPTAPSFGEMVKNPDLRRRAR